MLTGNPIFRREFTAMARAWKTRVLISAYLLALSILLLLLWPSGGIHSVVTENSKEIYSMFFGANLIFLMLLAPAFTSGAISLERENGTVDKRRIPADDKETLRIVLREYFSIRLSL